MVSSGIDCLDWDCSIRDCVMRQALFAASIWVFPETNKDVKIAANFSGETISTSRSHDFITGDEVYYVPGTVTTSELIDGQLIEQ